MGNKISRRRIVVDERYTHPQGLYAQWDVNQKKLRQLILKAKLAPCYPGVEDGSVELEECPICFLSYPSLNRSKCCSKSICTECYLQIKSPSYVQQPQCPFCKTPNYNVEYRGAKTKEEKGIEIAEEQKVIEAKIRMRQKEVQEEEQKIHLREHDLQGANGALAEGESSQLQPHFLPSESSETEAQHTTGGPNTRGWIHNLNRRRLVDSECEEGESRIAIEDTLETGSRDSFLAHTAVPAHILTRSSSRAEDYDNVDLEEMMYAEAIWRSIQDQNLGLPNSGLARQTASAIFDSIQNGSELLDDDNDDDDDDDDDDGNMRLVQRRTSGRGEGGLVGAVATLAEIQEKDDMRVRASLPTMAHIQAIRNAPTRIDNDVAAGPTYSEVDMETTRKSLAWTRRCHHQPRLDPSNNSWAEVSLVGVGGSASEWAPDHSSEAVEVGTSFSSSVPSASDIPWEAHSSDSHLYNTSPSAITIPESFEEQIELAIALSLDPAQAKRRRM